MKSTWSLGLRAAALAAGFGAIIAIFSTTIAVAQKEPQFTTEYRLQDCRFKTTGANTYFNLRPGYQLLLEGVENGEPARLLVTVLSRTKRINLPGIGMIQTRVVQEQHYEGGELIELSKNYFAICEPTNDLFYFGEAVNIYHPDGTVTHEGSWQAGTPDASGLAEPGIAMPGTFLLGSRYFQEIAEGQAMDRAEHTEMGVEITTEAGTFTGCVSTRETTPLDPGALSLKTFCPGIGLVKDGPVELVDYGFDIDDDLTGANLK